MSEDEIRLEERADGGRYWMELAGGSRAEMTFRMASDGSMVIDRTYVPPEHRDRGVAERLVERGLSDARARGLKIVPQCSYVAAQFRRHPEWADLLHNG